MIKKAIGFPEFGKAASTSTTVTDSAALDANSASLAKNTAQKKLNNAEDLKGASTNSAHAQSEAADATATQAHTAADAEALAVLEQKGLAGAVELTQQTDATAGELTEAAAIKINTEKEKENLIAQEANNASDVKGAATNEIKAGSELEVAGATNVHTASIWENTKATLVWLATSPVGVCLMIAAAMFGIAKAYDAATVSAEEAIENAKEIKEEHESAKSKLEDYKKTIDEVADSYDKLSKGVDSKTNHNLSLSDEDYQEYLDINNQLADMFPVLQQGFDSNGNAIINLGQSGRTAAEDLEYLLQVEKDLYNYNVAQTLPELFASAQGVYDLEYPSINAYERYIDQVNDVITTNSKIAYEGIDLGSDVYKFESISNTPQSKEFIDAILSSLDEFEAELSEQEKIQLAPFFERARELKGNALTNSYDIVLDMFMLSPQKKERLEGIIQKNTYNAVGAIQDVNKSLYLENIDAKNAIDNAWKEFTGYLSDATQSQGSYDELLFDADGIVSDYGEEIQNLALGLVSSLDQSVSSEINAVDPYKWVRENIVTPLSNLNDSDRKTVTKAYEELLALDINDLTLVNQNHIDSLSGIIGDYIGMTSDQVRSRFSLNVDDNYMTKYGSSIYNTITSFHVFRSEIESAFRDLEINTSSDLDVWNQIIDVASDLDDARQRYLNYIYLHKDFSNLISSETETLEAYNTAITESASATGMTAESISEIIKRYKDLDEYDESKLFEKTANGIRLNTNELKKLEKARKSANKEEMSKTLDALAQKYDDLTKKISETYKAEEKEAYYAERQEVVKRINEISTLASQYDALTSSFNRWQQAQSEESGIETYESIINAKEEMEDELSRGFFSERSKAFIDFLSSEDLSAATTDQYVEAYENLKKKIGNSEWNVFDFFTQDKDGNSTVDGLYRFLDVVRTELGETYSWIDESGNYHLDFSGLTDKGLADSLGMDVELVQQILRMLENAAGFELNLASDYPEINTIMEDAIYAKDVLRGMSESGALNIDFAINLDTTSIPYLDNQIQELQELINDEFMENGVINLEIPGAQSAIDLMEGLLYRKYELMKPTILKFEVPDDADIDVKSFYTLVGRLYEDLPAFEYAIQINDEESMSYYENELRTAYGQMSTLGEEIFAQYGLDKDSFLSNIDGILTDITEAMTSDDLEAKQKLQGLFVNLLSEFSKIDPMLLEGMGFLKIDTSQIDAAVEDTKAEIENRSEIGDVNMKMRPIIHAEDAVYDLDGKKVGTMASEYGLEGDDYATVMPMSRSSYDEDGNIEKTIVFTPILEDGTVLSEAAATELADKYLAGEPIEQDIVLRTFYGDDQEHDADAYSQIVQNVQQAYYSEDEAMQKAVASLKGFNRAQLEAINLNDEHSDGMEDLLVQAMKTFNVEKTGLSEFLDVLTDMGLLGTLRIPLEINGKEDVQDLSVFINGLVSGQTVAFDLTVNDTSQIDTIAAEIEKIPEDVQASITIDVPNEEDLDAVNDALAIINANRSADAQINFQVNYTGEDVEKEVVVVADVQGQQDVEDLDTAIQNLDGKTINIKADITNASKNLQTIIDKQNQIKSFNSSDTGILYSGSVFKTKATGTMLSPARASGTAYNMLNLKPAFANGKVSLSEDEEALVNELGTESIIRDGVWSLLPGGMHVESLKKGDIILSASQTKQLLNSGKAIGHGRAYASGTLSFGLSNAYHLGSPGTSASWKGSNAGGKNKEYYKNLASNSKKTSSGSGNGTESSADDAKESTDWIEVAIERIERLISNLDKTASAAYKNWSDRNKALASEIGLVGEEIKLQEAAYERYIQEAESVGLSDHYKKLVQDGAIDIETITNEDLKEKIDQYTEWYEKALGCKDAVIDLKDNMAELARQEYDNVIQEFEDKLSVIEHQKDMIEGAIDQVETKGHIVSKSYYEDLIKYEKDNLALLEEELSSLQTAFDKALATGDIKEYSEEWYSMKSDINDVESAIQESNTAIVEFGNNIRDLEWELFDKMQEMKTRIQDESDFLIDLMSDEKMYDDEAFMTDEGRATMGLHAVKHNAYMSQMNDYRQEIAELDEEYADDQFNQDYLDRRQELIESMRDVASSAKDEKQAIKDMVSDGYDALLDYMNKLIDKRKEMLQSAKDMYDYEKNIAQQTKEIASLEKQINAYRGDDSEENRATVQKLKVSLEEARENLEQTEYDRFISDQEQMYDQIVNETEEWINERLDAFDGYFESILDSINNDSTGIKATLESVVEDLGLELSRDMDSIWSTNGEFDSVVGMYNNGVISELTTTNMALSNIERFVEKMVNASDKEYSGKDNTNVKDSVAGDLKELKELKRQFDDVENYVPLTDSTISNYQLKTLQDAFLEKQVLQSLVNDYTYTQPSSIVKEVNDINNHVEMNISLPNVSNYEEFKYGLQHDPSIQKIVQSMTLGAITGKNSLSKLAL